MKHGIRVLAALLALIMVLGLGATAFALPDPLEAGKAYIRYLDLDGEPIEGWDDAELPLTFTEEHQYLDLTEGEAIESYSFVEARIGGTAIVGLYYWSETDASENEVHHFTYVAKEGEEPELVPTPAEERIGGEDALNGDPSEVDAGQSPVIDMVYELHVHIWGDPTYVWAPDNSICTARHVCTLDESHIETETAAASVVTTPASCTEAGNTRYTATFSNPAFETQIKNVPIDALNHDWGEPTFEWKDDNSEVTAKRVCSRDPSHVETETKATVLTETPATCVADGSKVYKVTFENAAFNVAEKTTKTIVIPQDANAHSWGTVQYTWKEDNSEVTAKRVCAHDPSHVETETVKAAKSSEQSIDPTCTQDGKTVYISESFTNPAFEKQTREVKIDKLGHDNDHGICNRCGTKQAGYTGKYSDDTNRKASYGANYICYTNINFKDWGPDSKIQIDSKDVDKKYYTVTESKDPNKGPTVITIKSAFISTLAAKSHTVKIYSNNYTVSGSFTIAKTAAARTGDDNNIGLWLALLATSAACCGIVLVTSRRKARGQH